MARLINPTSCFAICITALGIFAATSCKGRSTQTIEVTPTPPRQPTSPVGVGTGGKTSGSDTWGTDKRTNNTGTVDQFKYPPITTTDNQSGTQVSPSPTTTNPPPASPPPTPSPSSTPPSGCDRSNSVHHGTGYGDPFQQNGIWLAYVDPNPTPGTTKTCALAVPHCSNNGGQGYGSRWCQGPLTMAKDVDPSDGNPHDDSICVVQYGPTCAP